MNKLYKNKYIIVIYGKDDYIKYLFDNPFEMAKSLNKKLSDVRSILSHIESGDNKYIAIKGEFLRLYLIENIEEQDEKVTRDKKKEQA